MTKEIEEGSIELAIYDGWKNVYGDIWNKDNMSMSFKGFQYYLSFDWSRPVYEKFRRLKIVYLEENEQRKYFEYCDNTKKELTDGTSESFFNALVSAVKWYNEVKK